MYRARALAGQKQQRCSSARTLTRPAVRLWAVVWLATAVPAIAECAGDCNGDSFVAVNELVTGVNIALDEAPATDCTALDTDHDATVSVSELTTAVSKALGGCATRTPTPVPSRTYSVTGTIDDQPAEGSLILAKGGVGLNEINFTVVDFRIGNIRGTGTAQYATLYRTLELTIHATVDDRSAVDLSGTARFVYEEIGEMITDFPLSAPGYQIVFSATANQ